MLTHVRYIHTETALTLVNDESTYLEDCAGLLVLLIEILESHEVAEKTVEVAEDIEELVHHLDVVRLLFECSILCNDLEKFSLLVLLEESLDGVKTK